MRQMRKCLHGKCVVFGEVMLMKKICVILGLLIVALSSVAFAEESRGASNQNGSYCWQDGNYSNGNCQGGACGWRRN